MLNITPYIAYKSCWFESSNDLFLTEITGLIHTLFNKNLKKFIVPDASRHLEALTVFGHSLMLRKSDIEKKTPITGYINFDMHDFFYRNYAPDSSRCRNGCICQYLYRFFKKN